MKVGALISFEDYPQANEAREYNTLKELLADTDLYDMWLYGGAYIRIAKGMEHHHMYGYYMSEEQRRLRLMTDRGYNTYYRKRKGLL